MTVRIKPIIFSDEMVRAILDGQKTQTRRVMKPEPEGLPIPREDWPKYSRYLMSPCPETWFPFHTGNRGDIPTAYVCPYGIVGDRLWVRETWAHYQTVNHRRRSDGAAFSEVSDGLAGYRADGHGTIEDFQRHVELMCRSDLETVEINGDRWRPSIHMPRWASRITLEITKVRVERVQEISEDDAMAEGVVLAPHHVGLGPDGPIESSTCHWAPSDYFAELWDSINTKRGFGWDTNPWVWVIEFKRIEGLGGMSNDKSR